jgi:CelD/BcsL family acetyltransferase involved in cellulose biosynthesis
LIVLEMWFRLFLDESEAGTARSALLVASAGDAKPTAPQASAGQFSTVGSLASTVPSPELHGGPAVSVTRIEDAAIFESLRQEWNELLQSSASDCLFLTWEWLHTWWRHLSGARRLSLIVARRAGRLTAVAPLAVRPPSLPRLMPFPALEFLGTGIAGSDYLDLILRRGEEAKTLPAVAEYLAARNLMLELSHVRRSASFAADLAGHLGRRGWTTSESKIDVCPFVTLSGHSWQSYLASLGAAHFQRLYKSLTRRFEVRFEQARSERQRREALALLVDLHNRRWRARGGSDAFCTPRLLSFYDEVSRVALERGWLRLFVLWLNGRPAAALHGYRYGRTFYFYQTGFDPDFAKHSVGVVTVGLSIKSAIEEGTDEYDLLHGDEPYKFQWARQARELTRLEAFPPSARGRFCQLALGVSRPARRTARRFFGDTLASRIIRRSGLLG